MTRGRYSAEGNPQAAMMPGGKVLRNKLGICKISEMDLAETRGLREAQHCLYRDIRTDTVITADLVRTIHRQVFGGIYDWAGEYRTVNLSKGGMMWPRWDLVARLMGDFERNELRVWTSCRHGPARRVAEAIAVVHGELEAIHPFRDGNGRVGRLLAELMSMQAGCPPPLFDDAPGERSKYMKAVGAAFGKDYGLLTEVVLEALRRAADREGGTLS